MDQALKALMSTAICMLLAGCTLFGGAKPILTTGLPCNVGPIIPNDNDVLTRSTGEQIIVLNETGADPKTCGWKPPD